VFDQLAGERRLATGEVQGGERPRRVRALVEALEQNRGLLEPPLAHAQVGQARQHHRPAPLVSPREHPRCLVELGLRLLPAPCRCQDAPVVGAAEGADRDQVSALHELVRGPEPLLGASHVLHLLARQEHPAEHALDDLQVLDLARAHGRQGLVEEQHSLLDPPRRHQVLADPAESRELKLGVAEAPAELEGHAQPRLPLLAVRLHDRVHDLGPAALHGVLSRPLEQSLGPRQPPPRECPVAIQVEVKPGEDAGGPRGAQRVALIPVGRKRALVRLD
jgi:hypothetical protein